MSIARASADAAAAFTAIEAALADDRVGQARLNQAAANVLRAKGVYACTLVGRYGPSPLLLADPTLTRR